MGSKEFGFQVARCYVKLLDLAVPKLRRVAMRNLVLAFPEMTEQRRWQIADGSFRSIARLMVTLARMPRMTRENIGGDMAIFPGSETSTSGAIVAPQPGYAPSLTGPAIYLDAGNDLQPLLDRAAKNGARIKYVLRQSTLSELTELMADGLKHDNPHVLRGLFARYLEEHGLGGLLRAGHKSKQSD